MEGKKQKRSRAQRIYFVGPARLQPWSRLEAQDTGPYEPLVRPLVWQAAKRVLAETMVNAKEPYAIYKLTPVLKRAPRVQSLKELKPGTAHSFNIVTENPKTGLTFTKRNIKPILRNAFRKLRKNKFYSRSARNMMRGANMLENLAVNNGINSVAKRISTEGEVNYVAFGTGSRSDQRRLAKMKKKSR